MEQDDKVNILLVDDQPAKLMSYEVVLRELDENLIKAHSATEALQILLKNEVAVVLVDVCMPDLDGFELAAMIREHPRFQRTAIIFISAIHLTDTDYLRGYEMGGVDYVPVPVVPELLRAKVRVFADLYRKTRQLEKFNKELEVRVAERTCELEASTERLRESERNRSIALAAGQMGSLEWDVATGECLCDAGQFRIFGIDGADRPLSIEDIRPLIEADDFNRIEKLIAEPSNPTFQSEIRAKKSNGETRFCMCAAAMTPDAEGRVRRVNMVMIDITDRKQAEERQLMLAREVDHRARNALAVVQAIVRLTRATTQEGYVRAVEGRIHALAQAHTLLSETRWQGAHIERLVGEEVAPYRGVSNSRVLMDGPSIFLAPEKAQNLALALHELATNSVKYGALSVARGLVSIKWQLEPGMISVCWDESGGPPVELPSAQGFGTKIMNASIKHQLGGNVTWDWRPSGLRCTLRIPAGYDGDWAHSAAVIGDENLVQLRTGAMKRVLLAEDEAIIGMMMREFLLDLGLFVVGPCCTSSEALAAAESEFDCAILDLNLGGESAYPVASLLARRKIAFAFVTGYGRESVDARFANVPILQKPITRESLENCLRGLLSMPGAEVAVPFEKRPDQPSALSA